VEVVNPIWVTIPIWSTDFLITYTICWSPENGKSNAVLVDVSDTEIGEEDGNFLRTTCWLVVKGWFGK